MYGPCSETSFKSCLSTDFVNYCIFSYEPDFTASTVTVQSSFVLVNFCPPIQASSSEWSPSFQSG